MGSLVVSGSDGLAISTNKFKVAGNTGNTVVAGTLDAGGTTLSSLSSGAATLSSTLDVTGATTLSSTLNVTGAATLSSTLDVAGDVDVNSGKFAVTASDGSLAISSNKFTVAGDTGNTVVAGTLNATGLRRCRAADVGDAVASLRRRELATLSTGNTVVAGTLNATGLRRCRARWMWGDVDVNSGKFAVTASDGSLAISSNKFTVAGDTGNTVVAGTLNATGAATLSQHAGRVFAVATTLSSTLNGGGGDAERDGSCDAVEHAGCGRRRGREQWEVCGDGIGRVAGDFVEQVHGGWRHGQHGGGGDAERRRDYVELSSTLDVAGDVDVNSGKFAVTASDGSLAISSNKFTAGDTGNTVVAER